MMFLFEVERMYGDSQNHQETTIFEDPKVLVVARDIASVVAAYPSSCSIKMVATVTVIA
jgi:hypothetical protein